MANKLEIHVLDVEEAEWCLREATRLIKATLAQEDFDNGPEYSKHEWLALLSRMHAPLQRLHANLHTHKTKATDNG